MKTINTTSKSTSTIRELSLTEIQNVSGGRGIHWPHISWPNLGNIKWNININVGIHN